jgi:hypothetical protein
MNKILNNPDEYRGFFISQFAELEVSIDMFLAYYFIPNDQNCAMELIEILMDKITFENKRTALRSIFERKELTSEKIGKKKVIQKSIYKKLLDDIKKLSVVRDYFTHYKAIDFDYSELYSPRIKDKDITIELIKLSADNDTIIYTNAKFYGEIDKIRKCRELFIKFIDE